MQLPGAMWKWSIILYLFFVFSVLVLSLGFPEVIYGFVISSFVLTGLTIFQVVAGEIGVAGHLIKASEKPLFFFTLAATHGLVGLYFLYCAFTANAQ